MNIKNHRWLAEMDQEGRLVIPAKLADKFGLLPGDRVLIQENQDQITLTRSVDALKRVNIEATNRCNLNCQTCMRNEWEEPLGEMTTEVFERILAGVMQLASPPMIFIGGFGEPLYHPRILEMIGYAKRTGARVELITNATLLDRDIARALIDLELDRIWVSLDGASPDCYADIRLGAALPQVVENMRLLYQLRIQMQSLKPQIGVAFVAMQRNISDLPALIRMADQFGAKHFSISNVLAHNENLRKEMLYQRSMYDSLPLQQEVLSYLNLPRLDSNKDTLPVITEILQANYSHTLGLYQAGQRVDACPFLVKGSVSIRWDGAVSPCLPLLHTHKVYLDDRLRESKAHSFGSLLENGLMEIWQIPEYASFRQKLQVFDFSPCVICNSCEMANDNCEDCFGNDFPTCGGCLWAQGIVQCP